ncbi:MAG: hypothetical protein QCH99_08495 [Candidatus Bathyarchaeota archaeon]|nr:hypothetical protein [Candidatus Bathyarchaeum tardum]
MQNKKNYSEGKIIEPRTQDFENNNEIVDKTGIPASGSFNHFTIQIVFAASANGFLEVFSKAFVELSINSTIFTAAISFTPTKVQSVSPIYSSLV